MKYFEIKAVVESSVCCLGKTPSTNYIIHICIFFLFQSVIFVITCSYFTHNQSD